METSRSIDFLGSEHYAEFSNKYLTRNLNLNIKKVMAALFYNFWNLSSNNYSWNLKMKNWHKHINIIAPSNWIAECAKKVR